MKGQARIVRKGAALLTAALALSIALITTGCPTDSDPDDSTVAVTGLTLTLVTNGGVAQNTTISEGGTVTVATGAAITVKAVVTPADATEKKVTWTASAGAALVNLGKTESTSGDDGITITAKTTTGSATIQAAAGGKTVSFKVEVKSSYTPTPTSPSTTPQAISAEAAKEFVTSPAVTFTLTGSAITGTWKVYDTATGASESAKAAVTVTGTALTLASKSGGLPAGAYYVKVTESGKAESASLALTVKEAAELEALTKAFGSGATVSGTTVTLTSTVSTTAAITVPAGVTLTVTKSLTLSAISFTVEGTLVLGPGADIHTTTGASIYFGANKEGSTSIANWTTRFTAGTLTIALDAFGNEAFTFTDPTFAAGKRWQIDSDETLSLAGTVTLPASGIFAIHNGISADRKDGTYGGLDISAVTAWKYAGTDGSAGTLAVAVKLGDNAPSGLTAATSPSTPQVNNPGTNYANWYQYTVGSSSTDE